MNNAEEAALKMYPICEDFYRRDGIARSEPHDFNREKRYCFQKGYEQAEKDLALTWEDVQRIVEIADQLCPYTSKEMAEFQANFQTEEAYYREVLKRYNDGK